MHCNINHKIEVFFWFEKWFQFEENNKEKICQQKRYDSLRFHRERVSIPSLLIQHLDLALSIASSFFIVCVLTYIRTIVFLFSE